MSTRQLVCLVLVVPFLAFTAYVLETAGLLGFYAEMLRSPSTLLASTDLTLSLGLIAFWMYGDARETGTPFLPYAVITAVLGVAGPLLYLVHRDMLTARRGAALRSQGQRA
jgi:Terpene cyclase DEP1